MGYVPLQQPEPITSINFDRLGNNTVQVTCNGFKTIIANISEVVFKRVTNSDSRICVKNRKEILKYIFRVGVIGTLNGVPWTGTNVDNAIAAIAAVFGGYGDPGTKFNQTITVTPPASVAHTAPAFAIVGSSDSGLPLTYTSSNNAVFTIAGSTLTPVGAGTANIIANQAGDVNYNPAAQTTTPYTLT